MVQLGLPTTGSPKFRKGLREVDQFEDVLKIKDFAPKLPSRMSLTYRNSLLYQRLMDSSLSNDLGRHNIT